MNRLTADKSISEFFIASNEYCKLAEIAVTRKKKIFLSNAQKILTLIYLKASLLNKNLGYFEDESEKFVTERDWSFIQRSVSKVLNDSDIYIQIMLPDRIGTDDTESELLSDCFADIYQDLKDFTSNYENGSNDAIAAALTECIDNFKQIWGPKLLAVLVNLHIILNANSANNLEETEDSDDISDEDAENMGDWQNDQPAKI